MLGFIETEDIQQRLNQNREPNRKQLRFTKY